MVNLDEEKLLELQKAVKEIGTKKEKVNIVKDEKQYRLSIPKHFASLMDIDSTNDYFEFELKPIENDKGGFDIEMRGRLIKHERKEAL